MDTTPPPQSASQVTDEVKAQAKGFMGSILDFSFESFVTPKIIKLVYALMLIGAVLYSLGWLGYCFLAHSFLTGFLMAVITTPIVLAVGVVLARVYVELIMIAFKILEALKNIEANQSGSSRVTPGL